MPTVVTALIVLLVLSVVALTLGRSRRDAALEPTRLGPSWRPEDDVTAEPAPTVDPEAAAARAQQVAARAEVDVDTAATVLDAWDEYLGVLGLGPRPALDRRRLYDPYDPPVARRGTDGRPVPDPERVARDVGLRLGVSESTAQTVLAAAGVEIRSAEA